MATQNKLEIDGPGDDTVTITSNTLLYYPHDIAKVKSKFEGKKHVVFVDDYNRPIGYNIFPEGIESIKFGKYFNQQIGNPTHQELEVIYSGVDIKGMKLFPNSLKKLEFGPGFNNNGKHFDPNIFPANLEELDLGGYYGVIAPGVLPANLKKLKFGYRFNNHPRPEISNPLTAEVIPRGLTHLEFDQSFNNGDKQFNSNVLPKTLEFLNLGSYNNGKNPLKPGDLPPKLKELRFISMFDNQNQPITPGTFPDSLEVLDFGTSFMNGITPLELGDLPPHLKSLTFGNTQFTNKEQPLKVYNLIEKLIPSSITQELVLGPYIYFIDLKN